jgi:hypothetical protein
VEVEVHADVAGQPGLTQRHWYKIVTPLGEKPARAVWDRYDEPKPKPPGGLPRADHAGVGSV